MTSPADGRDRMEVLTEAYERQLPERLRDIEGAVEALIDRWDHEGLEALHHLVHRLAGSAGIYGFTGLSATAGALEDFLQAAIDDPGASPSEDQDRLRGLLDAVRVVAAAECRPRDA